MDTNKGIAVAFIGVVGSITTGIFTNWDKLFVRVPPSPTPTPSISSPASPSTTSIDLTGSWMAENPKENEVPWHIRKNGDGIQLQSGWERDNHSTWFTYDPVPNRPNTYQRYKDRDQTELITIIAKTDKSFTRISPKGERRNFYRVDQ